jgi:acyl-coenzyme A thioesterase PaaI-like protein
MMTTELSIQESLYPNLTCFGCGNANPRGLHLRSYREDDNFLAEFSPHPEHDNGFGFLNGGVIATVLDCHGAAAVMWECAVRGIVAPEGAPAPFITGSFDVKFHRPTPLGPIAQLVAVTLTADPSLISVKSELNVDGKLRATMTATWVRFYPRVR